jgi:hypothetical protein
LIGHHEVKVFPVKRGRESTPVELPEGWKPFAAYYDLDGLNIVARKWHRAEPSEA